MAQALRYEPVTPADELRELLTDNEKLVVTLRGQGAGSLTLLQNMDRIAALWPELEAAGVDLRPEAGRWETLQASLRKHGPRLVRELRAAGGLPALRAQYHADDEAAWWWYLAEDIQAHNVKRWLRAGILILSVVVAGAAVIFLLNKLFPVDPNVRASMSRQLAGQQKIEDDTDYQGALTDFQAAVALTPDDPDPWLWLGCTQQKLGNDADARASFQRAQALSKEKLDFWLARIPIYANLQMPDEARNDIDAVLAQDPENPQAYFYLAGILENQEQYRAAAEALQRTSDLADARNDAQLTAIARYRLAILMQRMQAKAFALPTPTPP